MQHVVVLLEAFPSHMLLNAQASSCDSSGGKRPSTQKQKCRKMLAMNASVACASKPQAAVTLQEGKALQHEIMTFVPGAFFAGFSATFEMAGWCLPWCTSRRCNIRHNGGVGVSRLAEAHTVGPCTGSRYDGALQSDGSGESMPN